MANSKKILIVDDNILIANAEKMDFESLGYKVILAHSGEFAIELFKKDISIDLIIMDIDLGNGIDGTETAERILEMIDIPIVFLSSHTDREILEKTEKITSYGYIVKGSGITVLDVSIKMAFKLFDAHKKLIANEGKLRSIFDNIVDGILQVDKNLNVLNVNQAFTELTGISREEVIGKSGFFLAKKFVNFKDLSNVIKLMKNKMLGKPVYVINVKFKEKTFEIRTGSKQENGNYIVTLRDITKQVTVENALEISEKNYQRIVERMPDLIYKTDNSGKLLYVSPSVLPLTGYREDEVIGKNLANELYFYPEKRKLLIKKLKEDGSVNNFEAQLKHKNGSIIWLSTNAHFLYDNDGEVIGIEGIVRNITKRKHAEKILTENENTYRTIFENTGTATVILDESTIILLANNEFENLCGLPKEEIEGKKRWTDFVIPEDLKRMKEQHDLRRINNQKALSSYEFKFVDAQGNTKDIYVQVGVIPGTKKSLASLLDISKIKQTEAENRKLIEEKEMLLKEVHHRIKNNLNMVQSLLRIHARNLKNPEINEAFSDAINRIESIVLLYDKLYKSDDYKSILIKNYFLDLVQKINIIYPINNNIKIKMDIDEIYLNAKIVSSLGIITNELLTNAMKHAFSGEKKGLIQIKIKTKNKKLHYTFEDNGIGLKNINMLQGFGLSLVDIMVKQIHGKMEIDSQDGLKFLIDINL